MLNQFTGKRWLVLALFGVYTLFQLFRGKWGDVAQSLIATALMAVIMWVWVPIMVRRLADQYLFFMRAKEMRAYMIEKDGKLFRVIIAVLEKDRPRFEAFKVKQEARGIRVDLINPSSSLLFIGMPWSFKVKNWYEYPADETAPEVLPQFSMILSERTIDYNAPEVPTADFIEITTKLVISMIVVDPLKAVYGVMHYMEAAIFLINSRWRRVATTLHFFYYGEDAEVPTDRKLVLSRLESLMRDPEIYQKAHGALLVDLWLAGRYQRYKVIVGDDGVPDAVVDGRSEPRYWNVREPKVMDGTEIIGGKVFNVYGDYEGRFFYVREEADDSLVLMFGKEEDVPASYVESDRSKVVVKQEQRVLFLFTKSGESWDGVRAYFKYGIPADKPARRLIEDFGVFPRDVEIQDIGTQRNIKEALEKPAIAITTALAAREEAEGKKAVRIREAEGDKQARILAAEGDKQASILRGEGEGEAKRLVGAGEGDAVRLVHEGHAKGFEAKLKSLGVELGSDAALTPLLAEAMQKVAESTQLMVMNGSRDGWTDMLGTVPVLSKLWRGKDSPPSQDDLIKALATLSKEELRSVIDALPNPKDGEGNAS